MSEEKINSKFKIPFKKSKAPQNSKVDHANWLEIGTILTAQGLNGEVRVYPDSDFPERFEQPGQRWLLRPGETEPQSIELVQGRYLHGKGLYVVKFAGVGDRNQAESLQGCKLLVPAGDRPPLEEDEFHVLDLIGLEVFNQLTQTVIGTVTDVIPAGNDLLEVALNAAQEVKPATVLVPFVKAIVPVVDLQQGRIEIQPPAGLIE